MSFDKAALDAFIDALRAFRGREAIAEDLFYHDGIEYFGDNWFRENLQHVRYSLTDDLVARLMQWNQSEAAYDTEHSLLKEQNAKLQKLQSEYNKGMDKFERLANSPLPPQRALGMSGQREQGQYEANIKAARALEKNTLPQLKAEIESLQQEIALSSAKVEMLSEKNKAFLKAKEALCAYIKAHVPNYTRHQATYGQSDAANLARIRKGAEGFIGQTKGLFADFDLPKLEKWSNAQELLVQKGLVDKLAQIIKITDALEGGKLEDGLALVAEINTFKKGYAQLEQDITQRIALEKRMAQLLAQPAQPKVTVIDVVNPNGSGFKAIIDLHNLRNADDDGGETKRRIMEAARNGVVGPVGQAGFKRVEEAEGHPDSLYKIKIYGSRGNARLFGTFEPKNNIWTADKELTRNAHR
jgi:hypothetical protein